MLGAIFNITLSDRAFLPWAALAILLAYTSDLRLLLVAGGICALVPIRASARSVGLLARSANAPRTSCCRRSPCSRSRYGRHIGSRDCRDLSSSACWPLHSAPDPGPLGDAATSTHLRRASNISIRCSAFAAPADVWLGIRRGESDVVNTSHLFMISLFTKFYDWWDPSRSTCLPAGATALAVLLAEKPARCPRWPRTAYSGAGRAHTLSAGIALIVLTNVVALTASGATDR
jgi:hypothetical protein